MQLNKPRKIRLALAAASCALIAPQVGQAENTAASTDEWVINFATLYYNESNRVKVIEPVVNAINNYAEDEFVSFRVVSDTMSGASPMGATASISEQTINHTSTAASGGGSSTSSISIPAYTTPTSKFSDQRFSIGVDWQQASSRTFRYILGANTSQENDYSSLGASLTTLFDTPDRLTTWTAGVSVSSDSITPVGGAPVALTPLLSPAKTGEPENENEGQGDRSRSARLVGVESEIEGGAGGENKYLFDALVGITQVVHRRVLTQLNYSWGRSSGYLTDPYKIISQVDPNTGETIANSYLSEKRPDSRMRQSVYWKTVIHLPQDVVHLTYRYYWDDWSIRAHTADINYRFALGEHLYLSPHLRYYKQSGANFFVHNLVQFQTLPEFASADLRLAPMESATAGLKVGYNFSRNTEFSVRAEYMQQWGDSHPDSAIGVQKQLNLFPTLDVMMYSVELSLDF